MNELVLYVAFACGGAALAWMICRSRGAAAEAREAEVRRQLQKEETDVKTLSEKLSDSEKARAAAETRIAETEKNLAEQRALLEYARGSLAETFRSLAAEVLAGNNSSFLVLAEQKFNALKTGAAGELEARKQAIESLVAPLRETLAAYQNETREMENRRLKELGSVAEELRMVAQTQAALQSETGKLVNALSSPRVRGRWGEITLRKTAELAGMSARCDFFEQASAPADSSRLRPDMIVRLPAGRQIVVDAKAPLEAFLEAVEAVTEEARSAALTRYAQQVNQHVTSLASRDYWDQFPSAPEFVVLFIPNESFLAAAVEKNPKLVESALSKRVMITTPTTFVALLRVIERGWRQEDISRNTRQVSELGQQLYDRMTTLCEHLNRVGSALRRAAEDYNQAVGTLEARVYPSARRLKELGAGGRKELPELRPVDQSVRQLSLPDTTEAD